MIDEFKSAMFPFHEDRGVEAQSWHGAGQKVSREQANKIDAERARDRRQREFQEYLKKKAAIQKAQGVPLTATEVGARDAALIDTYRQEYRTDSKHLWSALDYAGSPTVTEKRLDTLRDRRRESLPLATDGQLDPVSAEYYNRSRPEAVYTCLPGEEIISLNKNKGTYCITHPDRPPKRLTITETGGVRIEEFKTTA